MNRGLYLLLVTILLCISACNEQVSPDFRNDLSVNEIDKNNQYLGSSIGVHGRVRVGVESVILVDEICDGAIQIDLDADSAGSAEINKFNAIVYKARKYSRGNEIYVSLVVNPVYDGSGKKILSLRLLKVKKYQISSNILWKISHNYYENQKRCK